MSDWSRVNGADDGNDTVLSTVRKTYTRPALTLTYARPALTLMMPVSRSNRFTSRQLQMAFDRVCDPWDWRAPIWAEIPATERALVEQAVLRVTGSQPVFALASEAPDRLVVFAPGARLSPVGAKVGVFPARQGRMMRSWDTRHYWTMLRDLATGDPEGL